ncbi:hypothetical protein E2320_005673, partial [Naja naja]
MPSVEAKEEENVSLKRHSEMNGLLLLLLLLLFLGKTVLTSEPCKQKLTGFSPTPVIFYLGSMGGFKKICKMAASLCFLNPTTDPPWCASKSFCASVSLLGSIPEIRAVPRLQSVAFRVPPESLVASSDVLIKEICLLMKEFASVS